MKEQPRFSVVIPLYNKRPYIRRTVDSVLAQTFPDFELVVVDDGSTDGSAEVLASIEDSRLKVVRQANQGEGAARNTGMAHAYGVWLALLDADDSWLPHHLAELAHIADNYPQSGMISCAFREVVSANIPPVLDGVVGIDTIRQVNYFEEAARNKGFINASSVAIRRDVAQAVGGFSGKKAGADIEYWVKVALQFPVAVSIRVTSLYFRDTGGVMQQLTDASKDQPEPQPCSLREFSTGVALLLERADEDPALLHRPDIQRYINGMLIVGIRMCLYQGHFSTARHYAGLLLKPLIAKELAYQVLAVLPMTVLRVMRNLALHRGIRKIRLNRRA
jgi:hypothetical protein